MEVLNIVENMIKLGFYNNEKDMLIVLDPIIMLLDGSNDFISETQEKMFKDAVQKMNEEKAAKAAKGITGPLEN